MAALQRLAQLAQRSTGALRTTVLPAVKSSYSDLISRNAGAQLQGSSLPLPRPQPLQRLVGLPGAQRLPHPPLPLLISRPEYVVTDPVAAQKLGRQWVFTTLARRGRRRFPALRSRQQPRQLTLHDSLPAKAAHAEAELAAARKVWERRSELPLAEVALYAAFGAELLALFFVGEAIGRGSLLGYNY